MKCLICDRPLKHAKQSECECGESLIFWNAQLTGSQTLRQRGLVQAYKKNYAGALASFLEAALANPADQQNLLDAARALGHLGRYGDAKRLLENADGRYKESKTGILKALAQLAEEAKKAALPAAPADPEPKAMEPAAAPPPAPVEVPEAAPPVAVAAPPVASPVERPATAPLLGLPIMRRQKKGFFKRVLKQGADDPLPGIWQTVLAMENSWPRDWQSVEPWLTAAAKAAVADEQAVFHYMLGLAAVQTNQREAALTAFDGCLHASPPVLNAAAYFLYLHLENGQNVQKALKRLENDYDKPERDECRRQLRERLQGRGENDKAALLK